MLSIPSMLYLALGRPDGRLAFYDGKGLSVYTRGSWVPLTKGFGLARGLRAAKRPLLNLKLVDLPIGPYTWYLVLTEPNIFNVIARARATFTLEAQVWPDSLSRWVIMRPPRFRGRHSNRGT